VVLHGMFPTYNRGFVLQDHTNLVQDRPLLATRLDRYSMTKGHKAYNSGCNTALED